MLCSIDSSHLFDTRGVTRNEQRRNYLNLVTRFLISDESVRRVTLYTSLVVKGGCNGGDHGGRVSPPESPQLNYFNSPSPKHFDSTAFAPFACPATRILHF